MVPTERLRRVHTCTLIEQLYPKHLAHMFLALTSRDFKEGTAPEQCPSIKCLGHIIPKILAISQHESVAMLSVPYYIHVCTIYLQGLQEVYSFVRAPHTNSAQPKPIRLPARPTRTPTPRNLVDSAMKYPTPFSASSSFSAHAPFVASASTPERISSAEDVPFGTLEAFHSEGSPNNSLPQLWPHSQPPFSKTPPHNTNRVSSKAVHSGKSAHLYAHTHADPQKCVVQTSRPWQHDLHCTGEIPSGN